MLPLNPNPNPTPNPNPNPDPNPHQAEHLLKLLDERRKIRASRAKRRSKAKYDAKAKDGQAAPPHTTLTPYAIPHSTVLRRYCYATLHHALAYLYYTWPGGAPQAEEPAQERGEASRAQDEGRDRARKGRAGLP